MTDDEEKMKKARIRIERDAYSVLVSFKDGATPKQLETRIKETLGYNYVGKYNTAGLENMGQLLREHQNVRQVGEDKFKIIPVEEVADLVALISKQKEGKGKKKGSKNRRPATSAGYRSNSGASVFNRPSPKGKGLYRPMTSFAKNHQKKPHPGHYQPDFYHERSNVSVSFFNPPASSSGGFGASFHHYHEKKTTFSIPPPAPNSMRSASVMNRSLTTTQRPLRAPSSSNFSTSFTQPSSSSKSVSTSSHAPSVVRATQHSETFKPTSKACQMPSIREFSDNTKKMMLKMHPKFVHLSEMTELYNQEYGISVDPLQIFSKSWKMLVQTTFKEWLEISDGECRLKKEWVMKNGGTNEARPAAATNSFTGKLTVPSVKTTSTARQDQTAPIASSTLPKLQGFRYQMPSPSKSPTDVVVQKMRGLTMGARHALPTPEKPPGLTREVNPIPQMKNALKFNPFPKTGRPKTSMASKTSVLSELRPMTAGASNYLNSIKNNLKKSSASESWALLNSPSSSSGTLLSNPSSTSPPIAPPVRMRSVQNAIPSTRLLGRALADVKKQDDKIISPLGETPSKPLYVTSTTTPTTKNKRFGKQQPTQLMTAVVEDEWDESSIITKENESRAPSIVARKPSKLPPMSKGSKSAASSHLSTSSSRASSCGRTAKLLEEAVQSSLPDSEGDKWF